MEWHQSVAVDTSQPCDCEGCYPSRRSTSTARDRSV